MPQAYVQETIKIVLYYLEAIAPQPQTDDSSPNDTRHSIPRRPNGFSKKRAI